MAPRRKNKLPAADHTMRFLIIANGTMAPSPWRYSQIRKMIKVTPAPTKRPITTELFHGCTVPPYCNASKNMTAAGLMSMKPGRSRDLIAVPRTCLAGSLSVGSGILNRNSKMARAPPMGRLM